MPHTLKVLRREEARVHARRDRSRDEAAGYWLALAQLKVAASHLREASGNLAAASRKVTAAHDALRKKPPTASIQMRTLPDTGLTLSHPLCVFVSPLRLTYWKAVAPEIIEFRGEGTSPERAVEDLRHRLVSAYRQLEQEPGLDTQLWDLLDEIIRYKRPRSGRLNVL